MPPAPDITQPLRRELEETRARLAEAEETLHAIRTGEVDSLVVTGPGGDQVFTLKGAQEPYRLLIEQMSEGALTLSRDGVILYANQAFARFVHMPLERVIGAELREFISHADHSFLAELIIAAWSGNRQGETSICRPDGSSVPVRIGLNRLDLAPETLVCVVATDLTEIKNREDELRRLHTVLEKRVAERTADLAISRLAALDLMEDAVEAQQKTESANYDLKQEIAERRRAEKREQLGRDVLALLNRVNNIAHIVHDLLGIIKTETEIDAVGIRLNVDEGYPYYQTIGFPEQFVQLENQLCAQDATGQPIRDAQGQPVLECLCGAVLSGRTNPSLPFFTAAGSFWTNSTTHWFATTTEQDRPGWLRNQCNSVGYESLALIPLRAGTKIIGLLQLSDHRRDQFSMEQVTFFEGLGAGIGIALTRLHADEQLRDTNHQLNQTLAELEQIQTRVVQQEKLRALGQMASGIAHDFNNALSPIVGFSELLLKHPEDLTANREKALRFLTLINTAGRDASDVVRRLREFGRQRKDSEISEAIDLAGLILHTIELTQPCWKDQTQAAGLTIQMETALRKVPPIAGEESAIREILTNLIFNAVDALPAGGTITLGTELDGEFVKLWIRDDGAGMTEEVQQRCFEPFFTTKGEKGTGLGLAMVHGIVQRHGGTVAIASAPGQGTTITLRLPIMCTESAPKILVGSARLTRSLRVLVVDDEPMLRSVVEAYLTSDGHRVVTASSGALALPLLQTGQFDLVLTDKAMPEMNGEQLAVAIHERMPGLPVILMTGFGELMKATSKMPPFVSTILSKPITEATLREALTKVFPSQSADSSRKVSSKASAIKNTSNC